MAEEEASLLIRLKDEASNGLKNIKGSVLAVSAAVAGLTAFLVSSVKSFLESDKAITKLNASLKAQGIFTEELSKEMQAYANQLQRQTAFSDEAILSAQNLLTTFGLAGSKMKEATQAALNLSAGLGIDLNTASMLVGKAFAGQTETLGRYGIKIDEAIPASEKFSAVLEGINQRFGGAAQAQAESYAGKMENLKNRFDDIKEEIGAALIPIMERAISVIEFFIGGLEQLGGVFPAVFATGLSIIQEFVAGLDFAVQKIPLLSEALGLIGVNFQELNNKLQTHIDNIINMGIQDQLVTDQQLLNSEMVTQTQIDNMNRMETERLRIVAKTEADAKKAQETRIKRDLDYIQRKRDQDAKELQAQQVFEAHKVQVVESSLAYISSLQNAKSKELQVIGKAAAIAHATMNAYQAANLAMATIPPPFGQAMAAAVLAAGMANVAQIAGVKLAKGGIISTIQNMKGFRPGIALPRNGGVTAMTSAGPTTIAEAGQAEAVIPLGGDRAREMLAEAGIGGGNTVNVQVGILVGSENNLRDLARMIDRELFSLRKNNESVAFEAL